MDLEKIRTLLDFVGRSRVSELTVSEAGTTVVVRNPAPAAAAGGEPAAVGSQASAAAASGEEGGQADDRIMRSVSAGVLHRSASPGAAPLVAVGDAVEPGQALCIVEAMKVFTTVSAAFGGTVRRIFFEDGQDVGFGDPLAEII